MNWPVEKGLKVFTTLYPDFQNKASASLKAGLKWLQKNRLKESLKQHHLQAVLINVDVAEGAVRAVVGGRDFKKSQFNRAVQSQRQIGSLIKPVVLLSAIVENNKLNPLSLVEDSPWTYKYGSQSWSPRNYKNQYKGLVPLYKLLTHSLNAGTARLGVATKVSEVAKMTEQLGGIQDIEPHPSLILGAVELSPWAVSQIFLTLANMGVYKKQHIIEKVTDLNNNVIYKRPVSSAPALVSPQKTAVVVGMLREVTQSGTARWLKNFPVEVAGKTGTTNEEKDAWFVGFSPKFLTLVWLGFDDNRSHYLTGAEGALPLWESFMRKIISADLQTAFDWPEGVEEREMEVRIAGGEDSPAEQKDTGTGAKEKVRLVFEQL